MRKWSSFNKQQLIVENWREYLKEEPGIEPTEFAPTAQEEAEKINAQTGAGYVTDQAFWEKMGVSTGEELAVSVLAQTYSDLFKEIRGFRPKHVNLYDSSPAEIQTKIDSLHAEFSNQDDYEPEEAEGFYVDWVDDIQAYAEAKPEVIEPYEEYEKEPKQMGMRRTY
tara:strand:+ start:244 stop:744 length:501 start_codon:yes stop_codon:yes gene_type:complete